MGLNPMTVTLHLGSVEDKPVFRNLIQLYKHDLSVYDTEHGALDRHGLFDYRYLDHYWTADGIRAGRAPFLILANDEIAGFILKNGHSYTSNDDDTSNLAEFFVVRRWRRSGVGSAAAHAIFRMFPGPWEVAQLRENTPAQAFWRDVIAEFTGGQFTEHNLREDRWDGPVQAFISPG